MRFLTFGSTFAAAIVLALSTAAVEAQSSKSKGLFGQKDPADVISERAKRTSSKKETSTKKRKKVKTRTQRGSFY